MDHLRQQNNPKSSKIRILPLDPAPTWPLFLAAEIDKKVQPDLIPMITKNPPQFPPKLEAIVRRTHLDFVPSVELISMPEAPLVTCDVAHFPFLVSKTRFPHQGTVPKYPQSFFFLHSILSFNPHVDLKTKTIRFLSKNTAPPWYCAIHFSSLPAVSVSLKSRIWI